MVIVIAYPNARLLPQLNVTPLLSSLKDFPFLGTTIRHHVHVQLRNKYMTMIIKVFKRNMFILCMTQVLTIFATHSLSFLWFAPDAERVCK